MAVIDEIQMVKDYQRGWAWTRALLGVPAEEVHVCGEVNLIKVLFCDFVDLKDDISLFIINGVFSKSHLISLIFRLLP